MSNFLNYQAHSSSAGLVTSQSFTISTTPTAGNKFWIIFFGHNGSDGISSFSATGLSNATKVFSYYQGSGSIELWHADVGASPGTSLTVNTTSNQGWSIAHFESNALTGAVDASNHNFNNSTTTSLSSGSVTTTKATDLAIAIYVSQTSAGPTFSSPTSGWSLAGSGSFKTSGANFFSFEVASIALSSVGPQSCTCTSSVPIAYDAAIIALVPTVTGGAIPVGLILDGLSLMKK